jgi:hypothetical protein
VVSIGQKTRIGPLKIRVDRVIYTTITLLCVLIIYDGWEQLQFLDVVAVRKRTWTDNEHIVARHDLGVEAR